MGYKYYGADVNVSPINKEYLKIKSPQMLYDLLSKCWKKDTCAPRLQKDWRASNKTLGQCSITAFLVQDIFGGLVYGIKLNDGNYHCFNVVNGDKFDLTSEQFEEELDYNNATLQERAVHFNKAEKYDRYLLLRDRLKKLIDNN